MEKPSEPCRCGHDGRGPHPCHGRGYTCREPAIERFYDPMLAPLAGQQVKLVVRQTWACDPCWLATRGDRQKRQLDPLSTPR